MTTQYPNELRILSADDLTALAEKLMARSKKVLDDIAAIPAGSHTFDNTIRALAFDDAEGETFSTNCTFPSHVSPDSQLRDVSTEATKKLEAFSIESEMREDVYKSLLAYQKEAEERNEKLDSVDQRLLKKTLEGFERNGLGLESSERAKLLELKKKVSELCIEFQKNITEDKTSLNFTREELSGMSDDYIDGLKKSEENQDHFIVTLKYPDLLPILQKCKVESTRKAMQTAAARQCQDINVPLLEEIIRLRHEMAVIMKRETHADFILEVRMAKTNKTVLNFLQELRDKLVVFAKKEISRLKELKGKEQEISGEVKLNLWDWRYFHTLLLETEYSINQDELKPYFPLEVVTKSMFEIYQQILSVKFAKLEKAKVENGLVWHEDVTVYEVHDEETNVLMGHFYLDLYPRDGKYTHAAAFPLQPTYIKQDGISRQLPSAAMVANFSKPTKDKPSLLEHDEVTTYFHEFGHIMHNICSNVKYARFSGTSVQRDFVEAPSQMLENWCWEKDVLQKLSGHYTDHSKKLPEELIEKLVASRNVDVGILTLRQIFFGLFDNTIHTQPKADTGLLWEQLSADVSLIDAIPGANASASFGHLVGGYDAQYYGYLYSEVFSADMFSRFKKSGDVLSKQIGKDYRDIILANGGSEDAIELIKRFLGREPTQDAFLEVLGLK